MAIQYAGGTNVNATYTSDGTPASLVNAIEDAMNTAGWVTDSGHHSTTVVLHSATTPNGHKVSARLKTGSGQITVEIMNAAATQVGLAKPLRADAGVVWQFLMNQYQCFVFTPGAQLYGSRSFCSWGVPSIPAFMNVLPGEIGWYSSDTSTGAGYGCNSWRNAVNLNQAQAISVLWGGLMYSSQQDNSGNSVGLSMLLMKQYTCTNNGMQDIYYPDGSTFVWDPILIGPASGDISRVRGWLWDAVVINLQIAAGDSIITVDGKRFQVIGYGTTAIAVYAPVA